MSEFHKAEALANLTFNLLARCQEKENRLAEAHNLLEAEFKCFRIMSSEESLNNKDIAKRMKLSPGRVTRIMDGLVEKGYMEREIDKDDRRNMIITLSRKGKILAHKINGSYVKIHQEILQDIDTSQHKSLIKAMEHLHAAVERWLEKPR
jgi:DNA-binding MarR family transcriptional regulator